MAALDSSILKLLHWVPADLEELEPWCPMGALTLRLIRKAAEACVGVAARAATAHAEGGGTGNLTGNNIPDVMAVVYEFLAQPELLKSSFCSGWPVFRLLSLAVMNYSVSSSQVSDLQRRFFHEPQLHDGGAGGVTAAFANCAGKATPYACVGALRPSFEELHIAQQGLLLGRGYCPPRSFATWLDRMPPAPTFALCVRSDDNLVDTTIRQRGEWSTCRELVNLARHFGSPGCRVLDIGANIGACTVMLALLGYNLTAFEPLPGNVDLLLASLRLNGIRPILPGDDAPAAGEASAAVHPLALGDRDGLGTLLEGRGNAGMSVVVPKWPSSACDESAFLCHQPRPMRLARLDDFWNPGDGPVCLAKIDVEGNELRVLRGAVELLRARTIRVLHIEWWPPHLLGLGDEPAAVPWLLHALGYELFAPARWFSPGTKDGSWARVVPDQFAFLSGHWGDIIARPSEAS